MKLQFQEGAQTSIHAAVSEEASRVTGEYFVECRPHERYFWNLGRCTSLLQYCLPCMHSSPDSRDAELAADLWRRSEEILEMNVEGLMVMDDESDLGTREMEANDEI